MQLLLVFAVTYWNKDHIITADEKNAASLQQCVFTHIVLTAFFGRLLPACSCVLSDADVVCLCGQKSCTVYL